MSRYELSPENLENQPRPADVDYDYWAKELKRIGGVNEYNGPNIRLAWCPEEERYAYGVRRKTFLAATVKKMAYWMETTNKGTIIKHPPSKQAPECAVTSILVPIYNQYDVSKQRWALMEWWPPELVAYDWEENRYKWEGFERLDVLGPVPNQGLYRPIMVLETDDNKYRPPCEADLDVVRELVFLREMEHKTFGNREVQRDPKVIRKFIEELSQYQHDLTDKNDAELKERLKEALAPRINKLVKNPGVLW